ncbi:unnamed protein product [Allacma fusca]|uniref:Uncharacterized protein n=1 Tax=Allacma fusca TaxID=39272 RepID=A0A8J2JG51_9HEXA|nr:unnamed protein product [Allacma fusca]
MSRLSLRNAMGQRARCTAGLCCILLLVISSSPGVFGEDEEVIKERSPVYESGFRSVHISPQDAAHLQHNLAHAQPGAHYRGRVPSSPQELDSNGRPKSYAFAYAVKDGENGDDFSHKERREGKKTVGEYSVLLPDGRTQVVRYTSDAKEGFKADVTYEGGSGHLTEQSGSPTNPAHYQPASSVAAAPQHQISSPYSSGAYKIRGPTVPSYESTLPRGPSAPSPSIAPSDAEGPIYLSYPLKAQQPSLSPSYFYKSARGSGRPKNTNYLAATPSPIVYTENSRPRQYPKAARVNQVTYPGPSQITYLTPSQSPYTGPSQSSYLSPSPTPYPGPSPSAYPVGPSPTSYSLSGPSPTQYSLSGPSPTQYSLAGPSPTPYSRGSNTKVSPTPYKYYPSPTPNALYDREISVSPKYSAQVQRLPKGNSRYSKSGSVPPTALSSPYGTITRGQRAGPDPTGSAKHSAPAPSNGLQYINQGPSASPQLSNSVQYINRGPSPTPSQYNGVQYINRRPSPTPAYYDESVEQYQNVNDASYDTEDNHKSLVPVELFKAGPSGNAALLEEQSVRQIYTPGSPTLSSPLASPTPQAYFESHNAISAADQYSPAQRTILINQETGVPLTQSEEIYLGQLQKQQVQLSPVKSSVASYTTKYLGNTPKPDLFESTSNPGIPVGRPVQPSVGGLAYLDAPLRGPGPNKLGVKEALSRLPSVKLPTTRTYEVGAPDFGSSVSYSNSDEPKRKKERQLYAKNLNSNQLNLHDGVLREYLVEKKLGVTPTYEDQLV